MNIKLTNYNGKDFRVAWVRDIPKDVKEIDVIVKFTEIFTNVGDRWEVEWDVEIPHKCIAHNWSAL